MLLAVLVTDQEPVQEGDNMAYRRSRGRKGGRRRMKRKGRSRRIKRYRSARGGIRL